MHSKPVHSLMLLTEEDDEEEGEDVRRLELLLERDRDEEELLEAQLLASQ